MGYIGNGLDHYDAQVEASKTSTAAKKIRPGFYAYRGFTIERYDADTGIDPEHADLNRWVVRDERNGRTFNLEAWELTFDTLADAKLEVDAAIAEEAEGTPPSVDDLKVERHRWGRWNIRDTRTGEIVAAIRRKSVGAGEHVYKVWRNGVPRTAYTLDDAREQVARRMA